MRELSYPAAPHPSGFPRVGIPTEATLVPAAPDFLDSHTNHLTLDELRTGPGGLHPPINPKVPISRVLCEKWVCSHRLGRASNFLRFGAKPKAPLVRRGSAKCQ